MYPPMILLPGTSEVMCMQWMLVFLSLLCCCFFKDDAHGIATKFGAVLDMVTDRCTTACLLCYLCSAYPAYTFWFQAIISVDLASHYMHMYRYVTQSLLYANSLPTRLRPFYVRAV